MKITLAKNSGFCSGVRRAVHAAMNADGANTYVLGEIIHNKEVIDAIEERGVKARFFGARDLVDEGQNAL